MLKNIPDILSPALLKVLMEMGHGDEIVLGDGNFPSESVGKNAVVIRADGHSVPELLDAILTLMPLDRTVERPAALMAISPGEDRLPAIWKDYNRILSKFEHACCGVELMERFAFYERAEKAYAIVATGEKAIYANILLKKGVLY